MNGLYYPYITKCGYLISPTWEFILEDQYIDVWMLHAVYTFEANLSNYDRAVVHEVCKKMGMKSKSSGWVFIYVSMLYLTLNSVNICLYKFLSLTWS